MTEFIVVAHPRRCRSVWEPVHPGHMDRGNATRLSSVLASMGIEWEIWTAQEWEKYDSAIREELFDDEGNERRPR